MCMGLDLLAEPQLDCWDYWYTLPATKKYWGTSPQSTSTAPPPPNQRQWSHLQQNWKSEFYHFFQHVPMCTHHWQPQRFDLDLVFSYTNNVQVLQFWCGKNNWLCTDNSPFTDCNQTQFCCQFWLDMSLFYWFEWYWGPKWHLKCPEECPTTSLDITHFLLKKKKKNVHHSCLHPGTTQSAKGRLHWDARPSSVNVIFISVP